MGVDKTKDGYPFEYSEEDLEPQEFKPEPIDENEYEVITIKKKDIEKTSVSKATIFRTILMIAVIVNIILQKCGISWFSIGEYEVMTVIDGICSAGIILLTWWKNNSFTKSAIKADKVMKKLKNFQEESYDIEYTEGMSKGQEDDNDSSNRKIYG